MSNTSIILFGKPDSFESYELSSSGVKRIFDSFIEPEIKVSQNQKYVFHQFINDGFSYLQVYSFAQAFQSGREGIVIGVAFKSNSLIELCNENFDTLKLILDNFKNKALEGIAFKTNSLDKTVQEIYQEVLTNTQKIKYSDNSISQSINQSLLLYLPNLENGLKKLRNEVNLLNNVYISSNKDVYASVINTKYLYTVDNKFYTLNNENKIIEFVNIVEPDKTIKTDFTETSTDEVKKLKNEVLTYKSKYDNLDNKLIEYKNATSRKIKLLSIASILFCLTTFSFFFKSIFFSDKENLTPDNSIIEQNTESNNNNQAKPAEQNNKISLVNILDNPNKLDSLSTLCKNIKNYKQKQSQAFYDAIYRDGNALGLDVSFIEKYRKDLEEQEVVEELPIKKEASKKTPDKTVDPKKIDKKKTDTKKEIPKKEEVKKEEVKKDEVKKEEIKKEEPKKTDQKKEDTKKPEIKKEEPKKEEVKKDGH
jgi:hypothetical protein